jgi:hypothetical protein
VPAGLAAAGRDRHHPAQMGERSCYRLRPRRLSRATSKGPPFCHKLGTTSAVVGRVLIFV